MCFDKGEEMIELYNEDCLIKMKDIPDGSVDMILCDLPFVSIDRVFER